MNAIASALLAAAVVVSPLPAAASPGDGAAWRVATGGAEARANYSYDVDPGDEIADSIIVANTGADALDLAVYAADAYTTESGNLDLLADPADNADSGSWIAVDASQIRVAPGQSLEIPFTITVPDDAAPGDHPAGVVTSLAAAGDSGTLAVERRLGLRVHLRVSGDLEPAVSVTGASVDVAAGWNPFAGATATVRYTLENTGNTRVTATDAVSLAGVAGLGRTTLGAQDAGELLPGSSITVARTIDGIAPLGWVSGAVTIAPAAVGLGAQPLAAVTAEVSGAAISWSLVALLALVLVAAAAVVVLVLRRQRLREK
ncbi:WxL protein peptidoglycan domain-containing protein [Microbacterium indicum]|uniref:WxL protein peptidoglycan domain-containing protein n=1 Tax=Microbacterium indicum TaxID=358100 RepID=UPI0003F5CB8D|nr:DUF916 domain-containing protein [Microbacterium indicum]